MQLKTTAVFGAVTLLAITRPIGADPIRGPTGVGADRSGRIALALITNKSAKHTRAWRENESDMDWYHWNTAPEPVFVYGVGARYPWEPESWSDEGQSGVSTPIPRQRAADVDLGRPAGTTRLLADNGSGEGQTAVSTRIPQQGAGNLDARQPGEITSVAVINQSEAGKSAPLPEPSGVLSLVLLTTSVLFLPKRPISTR